MTNNMLVFVSVCLVADWHLTAKNRFLPLISLLMSGERQAD